MAFKMKGMSFKDSPITKKDKDKQVPLSAYEKKMGTEQIGGSKVADINNLEMRISDLKSDIKEGKGDLTQLTILKAKLAKLKM